MDAGEAQVNGDESCTAVFTPLPPVTDCAENPVHDAARELAAALFGTDDETYCASTFPEAESITEFQSSPDFLEPKPVAGDHTTIAALAALVSDVTPAQATQLADELYPCGSTGDNGWVVLCRAGTPSLPPGETLSVLVTLHGLIPVDDPDRHFQYGFVFDTDGDTTNNYEPLPEYPHDFFQDTDRWYEALYTPQAGWSLRVSTAFDGDVQPAATTDARVLHWGPVLALVVPLEEVGSDASIRTSCFEHPGDYGLTPPYVYEGSVWPPVTEGLAPLP